MSASALEEIARSESIVWRLARIPKLKPWRVISEALVNPQFSEFADFATRRKAIDFSQRAAAIALDKGL